ncbi:MAG: MFS transporter [Gemmatimonadales bacterium]|nr:MAG: MFS transporter [Gemmatimonadales bacterium]
MKIRGSAPRTLLGATLGFFVGFAAVSLFGPTARLLKESMGLGPAEVGLLVAVPSATGSLLRIPFGAWVETTGGRVPFLVLLGLSAAGMGGILTLLALNPQGLHGEHYLLLLALGMLAGCGIATFSVGIGQVSYWYPHDRQGAALATYAGLGNVAPGLFALLLPLVIGTLGITRAYGLWLVLLLAGIGAYASLALPAPFFQLWCRGRGEPRDRALAQARTAGQELFPGGGVREGLRITARLPQTWILVGLYFASFGGFLALTAWLPTYWGERFGLALSAAGALTMAYSVLTSVIRVPGGFLADRWGGERAAVLSFAFMGLGALIVTLAASVAMAIGGVLLMAAGMGVANAAVFKMVPSYLSVGGGAAGAGWVGGLGAFGGFALPPVMGALVGYFDGDAGYAWGFAIFLLLALASIGLTRMLALRWGAIARAPVQLVVVSCPVHGERTEVWAQALSGETAAVRLLRCSLLPGEIGELSCTRSCLDQVLNQIKVPASSTSRSLQQGLRQS